MNIIDQLKKRRENQGKTLDDLSQLTDLASTTISQILSGKRNSRIGTCELLAAAMDAQLVLIPNHLMPEVNRLLSGKTIGPDDVPTAAELILRGGA
ncbi:helix-turn-helix transcriptional regulator [Herbaspirillum lusitanum]|uniref:Helix-turn-helix transcriptional regulator n=1 Tax=Herbaspirillum lusitanum TaxID=213312 RepID=A0ABW9AHN6_9BURK